MSNAFRYGFRVVGDCRERRRLVEAAVALAAYAAGDSRCELDRESYLSAFQFDARFAEHLESTGSTARFDGPCWSPWLWFDVDYPADPSGGFKPLVAAREAARRLFRVLTDWAGVDRDALLVFLSGSKGFHVGVPTALWCPAPGVTFHKTARRFCEMLAERADAPIDAGVYDKVRLFRAPNSRHPKTGLHKRIVPPDDLMLADCAVLVERAREPAVFDLPAPTGHNDKLAALWTEATESVQREAAARAERFASGELPDKVNRLTLDFIREGAPEGERQRRLYSAAANLAECGAPLSLCVALLEESALDCGLPPREVRRTIENGWASMNAKPVDASGV